MVYHAFVWDAIDKRMKEYHEKEPRTMTEYSDSDGRVEGKDGGMKNDLGKTDWLIYPFETAEHVAKVMMYGEKKYARDNWKTVDWKRNLNACLRHIVAFLLGETKDKDSGFHPLEHALCDLTFVVWKVLDEQKGDEKK